MKKIYKSLAVAALAMMANAAFGQNLVVTADGNPVKDGDIVEVKCEYEDFSEVFGSTYIYCMWDPHLEVSTTQGNASLYAELSKVGDFTPFEICWPMQCINYDSDGIAATTGTIGNTPVHMDIHIIEYIEDDGYTFKEGRSKVLLECLGETLEFTLKSLPMDSNAVDENLADSDAPTTYYTLEGIQVENPTKGIYVARKGGKAKLVKK